MPYIPVLPSQFNFESVCVIICCFLVLSCFIAFKERKSLFDEYTITSRSLTRWLKESIFTMENKIVPKNMTEIKTMLNDVKSFQLDEYALRLKEKKKLSKLYSDLTVCTTVAS